MTLRGALEAALAVAWLAEPGACGEPGAAVRCGCCCWCCCRGGKSASQSSPLGAMGGVDCMGMAVPCA